VRGHMPYTRVAMPILADPEDTEPVMPRSPLRTTEYMRPACSQWSKEEGLIANQQCIFGCATGAVRQPRIHDAWRAKYAR